MLITDMVEIAISATDPISKPIIRASLDTATVCNNHTAAVSRDAPNNV